MEYRAIYKCRMCGEIFVSGITGSREIAANNLLHIVSDIPLKMDIGIPMRELSIHNCQEGSIGIADFQGFKEVEE